MDASEQKINILIVGATGHLGSLITKHALGISTFNVNILVRDPAKNQALVSQVQSSGGKVLQGDLAHPESLKDVTKDMHTVISAINGADDKVTVDGQIALAEDCIKNGVKRFVPSDFGVDYTHFSREELLASHITAFKVKFEDYLKKNSLPTLRFYTGRLMETFFYILSQGMNYWGEKDMKHDMTSFDNTAKLVVDAVKRPELTGRVTYSGGTYTIQEIQNIYNGTRHAHIEIRKAGSVDDLKNVIELKKSEGDNQGAGFLALLAVIYDPRSQFPSTMNKEFPDVREVSLAEFLKEHPDIKL